MRCEGKLIGFNKKIKKNSKKINHLKRILSTSINYKL